MNAPGGPTVPGGRDHIAGSTRRGPTGHPDGVARREIDLGPFTVTIEAPPDPDALTRAGEAAAEPSPGYWAHLWPSSLELARMLAVSPLVAPGMRVLELGCGLGLCGIACARRGAIVTMTDFNPRAVEAAARNARLNRVRCAACRWDWNLPAPSSWFEGPGAIELIIASDVLYEPSSVPPIARLIRALGCTALIADPARPQSDASASRFEAAGLRAWSTPARAGIVLMLSA